MKASSTALAPPAAFVFWMLWLSSMAPSALATKRHTIDAGIRAQFVRAMNEATQRVEETKHQTALMTRLLEVAKPVKTAFTRDNKQQQRDLENNNNYNYQYGYYNYQNEYYNGNYDGNNDQQEEEEDAQDGEADDAFAAFGGLNLTQYALKYLGCQNIHTFSDDMVEDNDASGILAMNRFVVFRLCPKQSCSNYNQYGCDYNYGEYTIPMDDYLAVMQYYHIQQYQTYCQTCNSCMTRGRYSYNENAQQQQNNNRDLEENYNNNNYNNQNYNNYNNGGGGQYYNYANDDANNNYNNNNNNAGDDQAAANDDMMYANDDDGAYNATDDDDGINCYYKDVCAAYLDACDEEMFTDDNYMSYSANYAQYFQCAEFNVGGAVSYLGPHCRSDGFTIGIGIYQDQYCSSYIGDMVDMEQVTGQAFDDEYLSPYYPKQCISCKASVRMIVILGLFWCGSTCCVPVMMYACILLPTCLSHKTACVCNNPHQESYDLLTDDEMENEENGGIYEVCGMLYEASAKCNKHLAEDDTFEGSYQQEANEDDVCSFTASLVENNYDEYGEVILESAEWELSKWKQINAYKQDMQAVSSIQLLGLFFSVGLVVALFSYTLYLRYKLTRRVPWTFGFGKDAEAAHAGKLGRAGSGITMQRSLSGLEGNPTSSFA